MKTPGSTNADGSAVPFHSFWKDSSVPTSTQDDTGTNGHFLVWGNGTRAIGFLDTAPFGLFFYHNFAAAVLVKFAEVQRLNGDAYGKGIYAATDLNYGKGFGRILDEFNGLVENVEANILMGFDGKPFGKTMFFFETSGFPGFPADLAKPILGMDGFMPSMLSRWYFDLAMDPSFHFSL